MRWPGLLLALVALTGCGGSDAVRTAGEQPSPQGSAAATGAPATPRAEQPADPPPPSPVPPPSTVPPPPAPVAAPSPEREPEPEPEPESAGLRDCGRVPPQARGAVAVELTMPSRVRRDAVGTLLLTNRGPEAVEVSGDPSTAAVVVRGGSAQTVSASPAIAYPPVTLQPGQSHEVEVRLARATCGPEGQYVDEGLPPGTYDVSASFVVGQDVVSSAPQRIVYEP